jgi:hypothetical protein
MRNYGTPYFYGDRYLRRPFGDPDCRYGGPRSSIGYQGPNFGFWWSR